MKANLEKDGYFVWDFEYPETIHQINEKLTKKLAEITGKSVTLEEFHSLGYDDKQHTEVQMKMTHFFRQEKCSYQILSQELNALHDLLGLDINIQANPYLRMTRPFKPQDNIGYHRDTHYGGSPYELSCVIPFVDLTAEESLQVYPGSHLHPESDYPLEQIENPDPAVRKGSAKHSLGFLYAPKKMEESVADHMIGIPLKKGQALVFSLPIVHGCVENKGKVTRWSTDTRVVNAFAPVDLSLRPDYYEPLSRSSVTEQAEAYLSVN